MSSSHYSVLEEMAAWPAQVHPLLAWGGPDSRARAGRLWKAPHHLFILNFLQQAFLLHAPQVTPSLCGHDYMGRLRHKTLRIT